VDNRKKNGSNDRGKLEQTRIISNGRMGPVRSSRNWYRRFQGGLAEELRGIGVFSERVIMGLRSYDRRGRVSRSVAVIRPVADQTFRAKGCSVQVGENIG